VKLALVSHRKYSVSHTGVIFSLDAKQTLSEDISDTMNNKGVIWGDNIDKYCLYIA
jgi:hypothetical protein